LGWPRKAPAYIEQAFHWAHEADPQALLFYNETEGEGLNRKSDAIYAMVKDFKRRGVPDRRSRPADAHFHSLRFDTAAVDSEYCSTNRAGDFRFTSPNSTCLLPLDSGSSASC
jgi:hypothetical protein